MTYQQGSEIISLLEKILAKLDALAELKEIERHTAELHAIQGHTKSISWKNL